MCKTVLGVGHILCKKHLKKDILCSATFVVRIGLVEVKLHE